MVAMSFSCFIVSCIQLRRHKRNMEISRGRSSKNWQSNQPNKSTTESNSGNKSCTPTFNPLWIIDPLTRRRYKHFEDMYTMTSFRGLVKQGSNSNNNNNNNNNNSNNVNNLVSQQTSLGGNINISGTSLNDPKARFTFRFYPPPSQYVEPAGLPSGSQRGLNYANIEVNEFWDINQYSNNSQNTVEALSPIFETRTNVPTVVELVPQNGGNHSAHLNQDRIIMSEAEANQNTLFEITKTLGVSLGSPSPYNQQDDVDLPYSTIAPSSSTSGLIRPQTFPYDDQLDQIPMDAFDHISTIPEIPEQSIVIPQFPMKASFQPNTDLIPQSTQQEYGVVSAGISVPSLPDFPSFFSDQVSSSVTTAVSVPSLPDFPPFFSHQESDNFTYGVSILALPDFLQMFTHQGSNNGGTTIQSLETILEVEDNMGHNNMNASVQWTSPVGKGIVNGAYDIIFVELGQSVNPHLCFFTNMQGNSNNP